MKDLHPLMIPVGVDGACKTIKINGEDVLQLRQKEQCRLQCKRGYFQSEVPYQRCASADSRTAQNGKVKIDKHLCKGAASLRNTLYLLST